MIILLHGGIDLLTIDLLKQVSEMACYSMYYSTCTTILEYYTTQNPDLTPWKEPTCTCTCVRMYVNQHVDTTDRSTSRTTSLIRVVLPYVLSSA